MRTFFFQEDAPRWIWIALLYCSLSYAFEGVYRWVLSLVGLNSLIYIREPLMLLLIGRVFARFFTGHKVHKNSLLLFIVFIFALLFSNFFTKNKMQVIFGVKIFIPIVLGYMYSDLFIERVKFWKIYFLSLTLVMLVGIVLDSFIKLPWEGLVLNIGGLDVSAGKESSMHIGGYSRLMGFSNSFGNAASYLICAYILCSSTSSKLSFKYICMWVFVCVGIILTTAKTLIAVMLVFLLCDIARNFAQFLWARLVSFIIIVFAILGVILPAQSIPESFTINKSLPSRVAIRATEYSSDFEEGIFASIADRQRNTWPLAFAKIKSWTFGNGFGAVGSAQRIYDSKNFNLGSFCDNMYVYIYLNFGIFGVILFFYGIVMSSMYDSSRSLFVLKAALLIAIFGTMQTLIENAFLAFFIGILLGVAIKNNQNNTEPITISP
jgi:hypothetical protein